MGSRSANMIINITERIISFLSEWFLPQIIFIFSYSLRFCLDLNGLVMFRLHQAFLGKHVMLIMLLPFTLKIKINLNESQNLIQLSRFKTHLEWLHFIYYLYYLNTFSLYIMLYIIILYRALVNILTRIFN